MILRGSFGYDGHNEHAANHALQLAFRHHSLRERKPAEEKGKIVRQAETFPQAPCLLDAMAIRIPSSCRRFRAAILPSLAFLLIVALPALFCVVLVMDGWKFDRPALLVASIGVAVFSVPMSVFLSFFYTASFSSDGIYGHSFWGIRRFVQWGEIVDVRPFWLLNLGWLRIYTADSRVTWLPLFQSRKPEFREEAHKLAPVGCVMLNHLR